MTRMTRDGGFTLVETTMAMAISAILLGTLVIAIYQLSHLTRVHQDSLNVGGQIQTAATVLNRDVISAAGGSVSVDGDDAVLVLQVLRIPTASFGQPTPPAAQTITYTYTAGANASGVLLRSDGGTSRIVASHIEALSFGPSRTITSLVPITISVAIGDQQQSSSFLFQRRPSE